MNDDRKDNPTLFVFLAARQNMRPQRFPYILVLNLAVVFVGHGARDFFFDQHD